MTEIHTHHVTVELQKGYQFLIRFDDVPAASALICDEPAPLGEGIGPNAAALLGAAVGNCLAASLAFCLRKARLEPVSLSARVETHVARNARGRFRIARIDVELSPAFSALMSSGQKRCEELFEDFCTVTASIRHGIPVSVSLKNDGAKTAA
jgi:uncharacterized OsmC-like protein